MEYPMNFDHLCLLLPSELVMTSAKRSWASPRCLQGDYASDTVYRSPGSDYVPNPYQAGWLLEAADDELTLIFPSGTRSVAPPNNSSLNLIFALHHNECLRDVPLRIGFWVGQNGLEKVIVSEVTVAYMLARGCVLLDERKYVHAEQLQPGDIIRVNNEPQLVAQVQEKLVDTSQALSREYTVRLMNLKDYGLMPSQQFSYSENSMDFGKMAYREGVAEDVPDATMCIFSQMLEYLCSNVSRENFFQHLWLHDPENTSAVLNQLLQDPQEGTAPIPSLADAAHFYPLRFSESVRQCFNEENLRNYFAKAKSLKMGSPHLGMLLLQANEPFPSPTSFDIEVRRARRKGMFTLNTSKKCYAQITGTDMPDCVTLTELVTFFQGMFEFGVLLLRYQDRTLSAFKRFDLPLIG